MRKHYLDNLRWVTVLLVLVYHVVFFFNNKGVFGGVGGFSSNSNDQPQDMLMYVLYPWFMLLLFLVAGISTRYAIRKPHFFRSRTRKLLVPATIGLFVFQWMVGYFNALSAIDAIPPMIRYVVFAFSGIGPLWFVQDLWLFTLFIFLISKIDRDRLYSFLGKFFSSSRLLPTILLILFGFVLLWAGAQVVITHPNPQSLDGLFNLYRPVTYFVIFLMGYYVFSLDEVQRRVTQIWLPTTLIAIVLGIVLTLTTWGQNMTDPIYLTNWLTNLYAWFAILAMLGCFAKWCDRTGPFATYMTRSSYGIYIVHYLVVVSVGYMLKVRTSLPPVAIYLILLTAVLLLSPVLYELLHRIPFIRWCVFGEKKNNKSNNEK